MASVPKCFTSDGPLQIHRFYSFGFQPDEPRNPFICRRQNKGVSDTMWMPKTVCDNGSGLLNPWITLPGTKVLGPPDFIRRWTRTQGKRRQSVAFHTLEVARVAGLGCAYALWVIKQRCKGGISCQSEKGCGTIVFKYLSTQCSSKSNLLAKGGF